MPRSSTFESKPANPPLAGKGQVPAIAWLEMVTIQLVAKKWAILVKTFTQQLVVVKHC